MNSIPHLINYLPTNTRYAPAYMNAEGRIMPKVKWSIPENLCSWAEIATADYVGVTTEYSKLLVIDLDNHNDDGAQQTIIDAQANLLWEMQPTYAVITKSNGYHFYYLKPRGFKYNKSQMYLHDRKIADLQVNKALVWAGKGYGEFRAHDEPVLPANADVLEYIGLHVATCGKCGENGGQIAKYGGDKYGAVIMRDKQFRLDYFTELLQKGNRHDEMIAFTWFMHKNMMNRLYETAYEGCYNDFYSAYCNSFTDADWAEGKRDWDRRQHELYATSKG